MRIIWTTIVAIAIITSFGCVYADDSSAQPKIIKQERQARLAREKHVILKRIKINDKYSFRTYEDSEGCIGYEILHNGKVVHAPECENIVCSLNAKDLEGVGALPPIGVNITGDGIQNLVVGCSSGGSHCCTDITIYSLANSLKVIKEFNCPYCTFNLVDLDGDGTYELIMTDSIFQSWAIRFGADEGYVNQEVILRYKEGDYHIAPDLMKKFPNKIDPPSLKEIANELDDSNEYEPSEPEKGLLELSRYMTALIYVGRGNEAFDFCHKVWPQSRKGEKEFIAAFKEQLAQSPYWPGIKELNGW